MSDSLAKKLIEPSHVFSSHVKSWPFFFEVKTRGKVGLVKSSVEIHELGWLQNKRLDERLMYTTPPKTKMTMEDKTILFF